MAMRAGVFWGAVWTVLVVFSAQAAAEVVRLANDPAVSPDGTQIVFAWRGDLWQVTATGGTARRLTHHPADESRPRFSPDGQQLAFNSDRTGSQQVFVMPAAGGEARQLTFHTQGSQLEDWYPAGDAVLVSGVRDHFWKSGFRFFRVELDRRTAERPLFDDYGRDGQLSQDGQSLLFTREGESWWRKGYTGSRAAQLWRYDLGTKAFETLRKDTLESKWPLWKPDGSGCYFVTGEQCGNLAELSFADKSVKMLTEYADDSVVFPAISADGKTIVFRRLFDLYVYRPESGQPPQAIEITVVDDAAPDPLLRRTLSQATEVAFTSDGLEVAFIAGGDVWVMDTELREPRQITHTPEHERDLSFSPDDNRLLFVSAPEGQTDIWTAERGDPKRDWWRNDTFVLKPLTNDANAESSPQWSPDGRTVAFVKNGGELWLMSDRGHNPRRLLFGFDPPDYEFSPDGRWIAYSANDNDFNSEIWIVPVDGSQPPVNISRHPDNDIRPRWSPDGKLLAFTGRRAEKEVDVYYVWLRKQDDDQSRRERKLETAEEKIRKVRQPQAASASDQAAKRSPTSPADAVQPENVPKLPEVVIDFDQIHQRLQRIAIPNSTEGSLVWSFDGKKLAFAATVEGKRGTYTVEFPESLTPKQLSTSTGSQGRWVKQGNAILWLSNGVPGSLSAAGSTTNYLFTAYQSTNRAERYAAGFDDCWRTMRDRWYDPKLGNRDWDAVREKYRDAAAAANDDNAFADVIRLMLGELNGSHLGFTPSFTPRPDRGWTETTAHLGVRFDETFAGPGLKIRDVLPAGPGEREQSRLWPGEIVEQIDGVPVGPDVDLTTILNGRLDRDITLTVRKAGGEPRTVVVRPISYGLAASRLYEAWVRHNRELVDKLSDGKLGYLHIQGMNFPSLERFQQELYEVGYGKDGLVIDVRENGGGSTTDHLLTCLTQPVHAVTVPRNGGPGYPQDRKHFATWNKPIIVLCNQNSFSNAEIFSHAVKTLKRGRVVGVPTAGGVISTGGTTIMDLGFLRLPFRGWFVLGTGRDMELNGAVPHAILWPEPGEMPAGKDRQIERAVKMLQKDVAKAQQTPRPPLIYATDPAHRGE
jgi:tricorn protease